MFMYVEFVCIVIRFNLIENKPNPKGWGGGGGQTKSKGGGGGGTKAPPRPP